MLNGSCVLMPTRDSMWSARSVLQTGINPDQELLMVEQEKFPARQLSLGQAGGSRKSLKTTHYAGEAGHQQVEEVVLPKRSLGLKVIQMTW